MIGILNLPLISDLDQAMSNVDPTSAGTKPFYYDEAGQLRQRAWPNIVTNWGPIDPRNSYRTATETPTAVGDRAPGRISTRYGFMNPPIGFAATFNPIRSHPISQVGDKAQPFTRPEGVGERRSGKMGR